MRAEACWALSSLRIVTFCTCTDARVARRCQEFVLPVMSQILPLYISSILSRICLKHDVSRSYTALRCRAAIKNISQRRRARIHAQVSVYTCIQDTWPYVYLGYWILCIQLYPKYPVSCIPACLSIQSILSIHAPPGPGGPGDTSGRYRGRPDTCPTGTIPTPTPWA